MHPEIPPQNNSLKEIISLEFLKSYGIISEDLRRFQNRSSHHSQGLYFSVHYVIHLNLPTMWLTMNEVLYDLYFIY